jgi:hypothetical protein
MYEMSCLLFCLSQFNEQRQRQEAITNTQFKFRITPQAAQLCWLGAAEKGLGPQDILYELSYLIRDTDYETWKLWSF